MAGKSHKDRNWEEKKYIMIERSKFITVPINISSAITYLEKYNPILQDIKDMKTSIM